MSNYNWSCQGGMIVLYSIHKVKHNSIHLRILGEKKRKSSNLRSPVIVSLCILPPPFNIVLIIIPHFPFDFNILKQQKIMQVLCYLYKKLYMCKLTSLHIYSFVFIRKTAPLQGKSEVPPCIPRRLPTLWDLHLQVGRIPTHSLFLQ